MDALAVCIGRSGNLKQKNLFVELPQSTFYTRAVTGLYFGIFETNSSGGSFAGIKCRFVRWLRPRHARFLRYAYLYSNVSCMIYRVPHKIPMICVTACEPRSKVLMRICGYVSNLCKSKRMLLHWSSVLLFQKCKPHKLGMVLIGYINFLLAIQCVRPSTFIATLGRITWIGWLPALLPWIQSCRNSWKSFSRFPISHFFQIGSRWPKHLWAAERTEADPAVRLGW